MGNNPSKFSQCGDTCPVERVSWDDAKAFINKLNSKTGKLYRLPSEAEWEYACKGGRDNEYCGNNNADIVAWHYKNSEKITHISAQKQANGFGLYDMSGNVYEWVEDNHYRVYNAAPTDGSAWKGTGQQRVIRGGSLYSNVQEVRTAVRNKSERSNRDRHIGLRLARTLP